MPDGKKIKAILNDRGMTQDALAKKIGTTETYMSKIVNGNVNMRENYLKAICNALGVKAEDIW